MPRFRRQHQTNPEVIRKVREVYKRAGMVITDKEIQDKFPTSAIMEPTPKMIRKAKKKKRKQT